MADARRATAETMALAAQTRYTDPSDFASRIDDLMKTLDLDEELVFVHPFQDGQEALTPIALFTVTSKRMLIHTGPRNKVIEIDPERVDKLQAKDKGLLSPPRLIFFLDDGRKRDVYFDTKDEVIAAWNVLQATFGEDEDESE